MPSRRALPLLAILLLLGVGHFRPMLAQQSCSAATVGDLGALNGWVPSPNDAWHQTVTNAPVDPNSANIVSLAQDLGGSRLHPDFSTPSDGYAGIPYTVVDSSKTPLVAIGTGAYPDESDITFAPIPSTAPIEGNPGQCSGGPNSYNGDQHMIVVDRAKCVVYETFNTRNCNGAFSADQESVWDMSTVEQRPYGYTSTDAAGLSVFEGLIRYDEIVAGVINHAIRFTAQHTKDDGNNGYFTAPASHAAGNLYGTDNVMGMRIRLKSSFNISGYSATNQIILKAMQQYGMILADNGSNMFFQGTPDSRWNDSDLSALKNVPASAFDVVQMGPVYDSESAPKGAAPQIASFTASADNVSPGTSVVLTPTVTGASYMYVDVAGFTRGPVTVTPQTTTTYTLTARNAYDTASAEVTVHVGGSAPVASLAFVPVSTQTYGAAPFSVSASSSSPGAITYSVVTGPASISGNVVTLTGAGAVTLKASQAASGSYSAATTTTSFTVNAAAPTITFATIGSKMKGGAPFTVSATSNSGGAITYSVVSGPATISGNTVTVTGTGTVTLKASQAAAGNYTSGTTTTSFTVTAAATTVTTKLTLAKVATQTYSVSPFAVSAASNSPAPIVYQVVSGPATISGNVVTITGAGTVTLQAGQAAVTGYSAATSMVSFTVKAAAPQLAVSAVSSKAKVGASVALPATSHSPGAITYSITRGSATLSGSTVTFTGAGTVSVYISQAATANYLASTITVTFSVTR